MTPCHRDCERAPMSRRCDDGQLVTSVRGLAWAREFENRAAVPEQSVQQAAGECKQAEM